MSYYIIGSAFAAKLKFTWTFEIRFIKIYRFQNPQSYCQIFGVLETSRITATVILNFKRETDWFKCIGKMCESELKLNWKVKTDK